jgi:hypothetical protein
MLPEDFEQPRKRRNTKAKPKLNRIIKNRKMVARKKMKTDVNNYTLPEPPSFKFINRSAESEEPQNYVLGKNKLR